MQKTPDETKKGLEHCINGTSCRGCPYCEECAIASDCNPMQKDLQEYIQQLEEFADRKIVELFEKVEQLQAERDAAVKELKMIGKCVCCKHDKLCTFIFPNCVECEKTDCPCHTCEYRSNWEWRGVTKEE